MNVSPQTPLRPDVNTSRLLRLLRPYTSHLGNLERSLRADVDHAAYPVIPQGMALIVDRSSRLDAKRTYGKPKSFRTKSSSSVMVPAQGVAGPSSYAQDVFSEHTVETYGAEPRDIPAAIRANLGLTRYGMSNNEKTKKILQQANSTISAFRRLCEVAQPQHTSGKGKNFHPSVKRRQRSVPKLSTLCANIVGHNLEGYVRAEWLLQEREKEGMRSDDREDGQSSGEENDILQEYQDQSWRVERLQEWYDALPGHVVGTVLVEQAVSLAMNIPCHPVRMDVLWTLLETMLEQKVSDDWRPLLQILVQDTLTFEYHKLPLVLAGIASLNTPLSIPPKIERIVIPHMANRKKYIAMSVEPVTQAIRSELAAAMVANGLRFVYNTSDQRQIDSFDSHTARWISRWTSSISTALPEESTAAWQTLYTCLADIGFLEDPLPVDNSPNTYLVAFVIALLDTSYDTRSERASLRKALRCLRSNPGIEFDTLHHEAVGELVIRLLAEPQWKMACPHITRWFLAHAIRIDAISSNEARIAEWICDLDANMPEVEEHDTDTKAAYARLGYVWDTTFDSWIKETPAGKLRHGWKSALQTSSVRLSSSPGPMPSSEDSGFYSGDGSYPAQNRVSPPVQMEPSLPLFTSPVVKMHTFSSPFANSPVVRSSVTPGNAWKFKRAPEKSTLESAAITPLQPVKAIQPNTSESIDPLDDIEELDRSTPVLPKRVIHVGESTDASSPLGSPLDQDENDPLAADFSDVSFDRPWPGSSAETIRADKRKAQNASSPLRNARLKRQHLR